MSRKRSINKGEIRLSVHKGDVDHLTELCLFVPKLCKCKSVFSFGFFSVCILYMCVDVI